VALLTMTIAAALTMNSEPTTIVHIGTASEFCQTSTAVLHSSRSLHRLTRLHGRLNINFQGLTQVPTQSTSAQLQGGSKKIPTQDSPCSTTVILTIQQQLVFSGTQPILHVCTEETLLEEGGAPNGEFNLAPHRGDEVFMSETLKLFLNEILQIFRGAFVKDFVKLHPGRITCKYLAGRNNLLHEIAPKRRSIDGEFLILFLVVKELNGHHKVKVPEQSGFEQLGVRRKAL